MTLYDSIALIVNIVLVIVIVVNLVWFIGQERIKRLERRLGKFSVESINVERESLFDVIINIYVKMRGHLNRFLYKSKYFKEYATKYEKYTDKTNPNRRDAMNYVSTKFLCAFLILFLVFANNVLQHNPIGFYQSITGFLIGFFIPDMFLFGKNKLIERRMESDILKAITIMNNSFKSGKSIMQSIKLVSEELDSPLGLEFKKMYVDLTYGLSLDIVFKRFESRVNIDDVKYITTSLTILNETGGDIVKVFESVEKTFFNNKKLKDELKNLTASSKLLYYVLLFIPVIFAILIYLLDNTYFTPLFTSTIGYLVLITCICIYVSYILVIKKIMKMGDSYEYK